ncbi:MAG: ribonuclease domain-containing protein, partial [Pseudonocardiaceae bacterium]
AAMFSRFLVPAAFLAVLGTGLDAPAYQRSESQAQSRLGEVDVAQLPSEARQTLELIKQAGPFPYSRDGISFGNRERILPRRERGYYHEYTVPTPGAKNRGARRIIAGITGEYYYTDDHYRSFRRIKE